MHGICAVYFAYLVRYLEFWFGLFYVGFIARPAV